MPGTTTVVVANEMLSSMTFNHRKEVLNTRNLKYPVVERWLKAKKDKAQGETLIQPFSTEDHSRPTQLQTGYERYDDRISTTLTPGSLTPAFLAQPVMISEIDRVKNAGSGKVVDLAKDRTQNVDDHLARQASEVILKGPAASGTYVGQSAWSGWKSLNGLDSTSGYLEAVANGTNTFYGLAKGTFPVTSHPLFHNLLGDCANAVGTNGLNVLTQIGIDLRARYGELPRGRFEWYCSRIFAMLLKRTLRVAEQYVQDGVMDDGKRMATMVDGIKLVPTFDLAQAGTTSGNAATLLSAMLVDWENFGPSFYPGWAFDQTKWVDVPGTVGVQASLFKIGGQNMAKPVGSMAVLIRGEAF